MYIEKVKQIENILKNYFEGIFYGDLAKLRAGFHSDVRIYGDIKGEAYEKNLDEYLTGVQNRKSPQEQGEKFAMKILGIEILGNIATAKLHVPMLGFNYYDYISLVVVDNEWKIVNKLFVHVEPN